MYLRRKKIIVLNDSLGHFKQFEHFFLLENWSLRPQPARHNWKIPFFFFLNPSISELFSRPEIIKEINRLYIMYIICCTFLLLLFN